LQIQAGFYPQNQMLTYFGLSVNSCTSLELFQSILKPYSKNLYPKWQSRMRNLISQTKKRPLTTTFFVNELSKWLQSAFSILFPEVADGSHSQKQMRDLFFKKLGRNDGKKEELVFDHGVWAAANLCLYVEDSISSLKANNIDKARIAIVVLRESALAMALHNLRAKKLLAADHPLIWLLRLCDELHEWNRAVFVDYHLEREEGKRVVLGPFHQMGDDIYFDDQLRVSFEYDDEALKRTHWSYEEFVRSKQKLGLSELKDVGIERPHELHLGFYTSIL